MATSARGLPVSLIEDTVPKGRRAPNAQRRWARVRDANELTPTATTMTTPAKKEHSSDNKDKDADQSEDERAVTQTEQVAVRGPDVAGGE